MSDIFIGRQPIFDKNMNVFAYELLFRSDSESYNAIKAGDSATSQVLLNCFVDIGLENIVGSHKAFIKLSEAFITNPDLIMAVPREQVVLEVGEDMQSTDGIVDTLKDLKRSGYTITLDNFRYDSSFHPMLEVSDVIKIDIMALDNNEIIQLIEKLKPYKLKLLAEKIETYDEFEFLKELEFDYYQGYFFSSSKTVSGKTLDASQLALLQLVASLNDPDIEVDELSQIIQSDVALSYKVLKFLNSPISGLRAKVDSIRQAVVLLGLATIRNWVTILTLAAGAINKSPELGVTVLIRARCCELLARKCGLAKPESFFTVGLFSSLDVMMDQPLTALLEELPLCEDSKLALLEHKGVFGEALVCALAMEHSDFSIMGFGDLGLAELSDIYLEAIRWADELSNSF